MTGPAAPRGLVFGTAAETYERFRLGYPDEVVDRTLDYAGAPVSHAIEVGAGTGKATRAFASRGIAITAVEPDEGMHAVLERETTGLSVTTVRSTFEAYDGPPGDLLYAGASFHWTDPATRWSHAADLLTDRGVLALFGSQLRATDPDLEAAIADALGDHVEAPAASSSDGSSGTPGWGWRPGELEASGLFTDVRHHRVERVVLLSQQEYVGHLTTVSAFLQLPWAARQHVLGLAVDLVPDQVSVDASVELELARRAR